MACFRFLFVAGGGIYALHKWLRCLFGRGPPKKQKKKISIYTYIYIYIFSFCFLLEALCLTGSATTYAKHKCLHPPRTKNKNKPSNPTRSPTPTTISSKDPRKPWGARGRRTRKQDRAKTQKRKRPSNPSRSPTQPQQLRPKTQKPRRASGKRTRRQARTNKTGGSECKRGGATSCNPGSCRAVAEKTGQRPPVGAPHGVRDDGRTDERTDDQAAEGAWPGGCGVQQDTVPMR